MNSTSVLDKFIDFTVFSLPKCDFCKNYHYDEKNNKIFCIAFPNGIPDDTIWNDLETECCNGIYFEEA